MLKSVEAAELQLTAAYDLKSARCKRITVSGRTIVSAPYVLETVGRHLPISVFQFEMEESLLGPVRRGITVADHRLEADKVPVFAS